MKMFIEKLAKSELWVTMAAMAASALSSKLGIPDAAIQSFIMSMSGLAVAYIGGRSFSKPREMQASASIVVTPKLP